MSYRQRLQMKVVRTIHEVHILKDAEAHSVKSDLDKVPIGAVLTDWNIEDDGHSFFVLTFTEEKVDD